MKKWLLDLHVYLGLFCAGYFVIYGVSTLAYNHRWRPAPTAVTWERSIELPEIPVDRELAERAADALGLFGWINDRGIRRESPARLRFTVHRPARRYRVELDQAEARARVEEQRTGLAGAVLALHGLMRTPGSSWGTGWALYTELSAVTLGFAVASGLYFWWLRTSARQLAWLLLAGGGGSLALMLWIAR